MTRFSFKSVASQSETAGNKVDNITFIIADPLYYDSNGGTGNLPIPQPSGNYPGYYQRGTSITLSAVVPVREGYSFLGWTEAKHPDVTSASELSSIPTIKSKTIQAGSNYVYALWGKNPTITFKDPVTGMVISSVTIPFNALLPTTDVPDAPEHPGYVFRGFTPSTTGTFSSDTEIELVYEPQAIIKVNMKWVDLDDAMGNRPDIDLTIPSFTNPACTIPIHVDKTSSSSAAAFNPDVFVPPDTFALPDISPYAIRIHSCTEGTVDGIKTVTYEIRADYIPTEDVAVMKIWDDMSDAYGERPKSVTVNVYKRNPNVPADTEEPPDESAFWELYDTIEMLPAPEEATGDSNSWRYVLKDVPMWTATGHDGDVLIDAEYKVVEHDVYGYDTVSVTGSIEEGSFIITNRIWKHVDMPETGEHDVLFFYVSGVILLLASSIMIAIKREAIALN